MNHQLNQTGAVLLRYVSRLVFLVLSVIQDDGVDGSQMMRVLLLDQRMLFQICRFQISPLGLAGLSPRWRGHAGKDLVAEPLLETVLRVDDGVVACVGG